MIESLSRWLFMRPIDGLAVSGTEMPDDLMKAQFRPTLGVALGGGAARGWAHIGVMRALDEGGIRPDIVTGTSIGAVVGGCYLAGKLDELEKFARSLNKRRMFGLLDFALGSSGLINGTKLASLLEQNLGDLRIEELDRPFTCVATELGTGHEIWLRSGSIVEALRASYALPGIFQPSQIGGRWLVDGALVNPIPVSVCRALGARVVIAVNLNPDVFGSGTAVIHPMPPAPADALPEVDDMLAGMAKPGTPRSILKRQLFGRSKDGLPGISGVMMEAFNIIQDRIGRSRLAGDPPDVTIGPRLAHLSLFEFDRAEEAISIGYETGLKALDEIRDYISALS